MKKNAITGAFGFSGKYITQRLLNKGERVMTLTNSPDRPNPFGHKVEVRPLSFDNKDQLVESLQGVDVLYNTYWVRFNHNSLKHLDAVKNSLILFDAAKKAGVSKVVHISITNPDENSPLAYFRGKGILERELKASGLAYSIVRPAALFGDEGILINNIAWTLRKFPIFAVFGDPSQYHMCPIYVDDLAKIMIDEAETAENRTINALGPEDFTYRELVQMIGKTIGFQRPMMSMPPDLGYLSSRIIGFFMGDIFATREEIRGLMADLLHVKGEKPLGITALSQWVEEHANTLGVHYASELARWKNRNQKY